MKTYAIKEAFLTLQGEGFHAGSRAVFVRTTGCNVWSGREEDRERDSHRGVCAAFCDTDFVGTNGERGGRYSAEELRDIILELWEVQTPNPRVVLTGGEPSLILDEHLVTILHEAKIRIHVETNGSCLLPSFIDWVTLSPKPPMRVLEQHYDEVKVVYPVGINPEDYESFASHKFVQPLDQGSLLREVNIKACVNFVLGAPAWRLSLQTHKVLGIP